MNAENRAFAAAILRKLEVRIRSKAVRLTQLARKTKHASATWSRAYAMEEARQIIEQELEALEHDHT